MTLTAISITLLITRNLIVGFFQFNSGQLQNILDEENKCKESRFLICSLNRKTCYFLSLFHLSLCPICFLLVTSLSLFVHIFAVIASLVWICYDHISICISHTLFILKNKSIIIKQFSHIFEATSYTQGTYAVVQSEISYERSL